MNSLAVLALLAPGSVADLTPAEVEARAIKARTDITSAHVRATVRGEGYMHRPEERRRYDEVLEIYQSPAGSRKDRRARPGSVLPEGGLQRMLVCRGCGPDGGFVEFHQPKTAIDVFPKNTPSAGSINLGLSDVRRLGYSHTGFYGASGEINSIVGSGLIRYSGVERTTFKGDDALLVRGEVIKVPGNRYSCWVLPAKGYNVARIEFVQPAHPDKPSFAESELALDKPSGVWFPKRVVCKLFGDGRQIWDENIEMSVAEFNRVPDGVFSMTALDLPKNELVYDHRTNSKAYWNGKEISRAPATPPAEDQVVRPATTPEPVEPLPTRSWDRWVAAAACVLLAVAGVGASRRVFR